MADALCVLYKRFLDARSPGSNQDAFQAYSDFHQGLWDAAQNLVESEKNKALEYFASSEGFQKLGYSLNGRSSVETFIPEKPPEYNLPELEERGVSYDEVGQWLGIASVSVQTGLSNNNKWLRFGRGLLSYVRLGKYLAMHQGRLEKNQRPRFDKVLLERYPFTSREQALKYYKLSETGEALDVE
ncbi:MAG: hypothetical protein HY831_02690 [Candidatus Aenigmarchaeota archaeon]|nr:hypothetical protein [Candidatus Aenigmarchaeota archaeon]